MLAAGCSPAIADTLPPDALILISTRNLVLFPGTVLPVTLGRQRSIAAAQTAIRLGPVGLVLQRDVTRRSAPGRSVIGTEANLLRYDEPGRQSSRHLPGRGGGASSNFSTDIRFCRASNACLRWKKPAPRSTPACCICNQALEVPAAVAANPGELVNAVQNVTSAPGLADLIASFMDITSAEKQEISKLSWSSAVSNVS